MKKLAFAYTLLLVLAGFTAPSAEALPICFKWCAFCDGIEVSSLNNPCGGKWYHWDCASDSCVEPRGGQSARYRSNCGTNGKFGIRSVAPNGPGDYYFIVDAPLDGTLDMHQGTYPNGSCWIPGLCYNLQMGACTGVNGANRSTVQ